MSKSDGDSPKPRSMRHKQILDAAAEHPDAAMAELADMVPSATVDLVEYVLEEHGDPGDTPGESGTSAASARTDEETTDDRVDGTPSIESTQVDSPSPPAAADGDSGEERTDDETGGHADPDGADLADERTDGSTEPDETNGDHSPGDDVGDVGEDADEAGEEGSGEAVDDGNEPEDETVMEELTGPTAPDLPAFDTLSDAEQETLRAIAANPAATQAELAEELGVTAATISQRIARIDGFDWQARQALVTVYEDLDHHRATDDSPTRDDDSPTAADDSTTRDDGSPTAADDSTTRDDGSPTAEDEPMTTTTDTDLEALTDRLETIESTLEDLQATLENGSTAGLDDPDLAHKVVHACVHSEQITEDEELQVIRALLE